MQTDHTTPSRQLDAASYCLIHEDLVSPRPLARTADEANVSEVSESSSRLIEAAPALRIERVRASDRDQVLIFTAPGSTLRRNGIPAPLITPLVVGDQLAPDAATLLHVSRRQAADAIRPPAALIGRVCGVCRVEIEPATFVVICDRCGDARHLEGEEKPADERLECAEVGDCPVCQTPRPRESGLSYWPAG